MTNHRVAAAAKAFNLPQILWHVDPEDWKNRNARLVARRVLAGTRRGAVVLMHDIHPTSISAVPRILAALAAKGFKFVTVSDLLADRKIKPGQLYEQR
jgi:peptidoglycan/xylan/chitin deacetylase (PgdA/CDA1 family)